MGTPPPTPIHRDPLRAGLPPYPHAEMEAGCHARRVEVNVGVRGGAGPSSPPLPATHLPPPPTTTAHHRHPSHTPTPTPSPLSLSCASTSLRGGRGAHHEEEGEGADGEHEKASQQLKRARVCVCDNLEARHTTWLWDLARRIEGALANLIREIVVSFIKKGRSYCERGRGGGGGGAWEVVEKRWWREAWAHLSIYLFICLSIDLSIFIDVIVYV